MDLEGGSVQEEDKKCPKKTYGSGLLTSDKAASRISIAGRTRFPYKKKYSGQIPVHIS